MPAWPQHPEGWLTRRTWSRWIAAVVVPLALLSSPMSHAADLILVDRGGAGIVPGPGPQERGPDTPTSDALPTVAATVAAMGATSGFAGARTVPAEAAVFVWWKGVAPADVRAYVASRPQGVDVRLIEGAAYSKAELEAARARLTASPLLLRLRAVLIEVAPEGTGITVGIQDAAISDADLAALRAVAGIVGVSVRTGAGPAGPYEAIEAPEPRQRSITCTSAPIRLRVSCTA